MGRGRGDGGFLQARLQVRHGALLGAVITAPLFALQHLALFVGNGLAAGLAILAAATALFIPFRAMLGWLYNRTGSLFLVGLLHAAGNAVAAGTFFGDSFLMHLYDAPALSGLPLAGRRAPRPAADCRHAGAARAARSRGARGARGGDSGGATERRGRSAG